MYNGDAPPQYFAPQGASKVNPNQGGMEMPMYGQAGGVAMPQGQQQSGVVGSGSGMGGGNGDVEQQQGQQLPPRPQQAKAALRGMLDRFRK